MRRLAIGLALVVGLLLMLASVAAATPPFCDPDSPRYDPDHSACSDTTPTDPTTTTTEPPTLQACTNEVLADIGDGANGRGRVAFECLWTPAVPESIPVEGLEGTVTVETTRAISQLVVGVRDDSPGDICLLTQPGSIDSTFGASFPLTYGELPDDVEWDPYDDYPDFAPYEGETYWSFGGTHWCYPQDEIAGMRTDLNGKPLHLNVSFLAKKNTAVNVTLYPPQG